MKRFLTNTFNSRATGVAIFALAVCLMTGLPVTAQQDPFGDNPFESPDPMDERARTEEDAFDFGRAELPSDLGTSPAPDSAARPEDASLEDPLVFILNERPPKSPGEVGRFLKWMSQLEHWSQVGKLLEQVADSNWDLGMKAEVAQATGAATLRRLRSIEVPLSEGQRKAVSELLRSPSELASTANVIDQRIDQLGDENPAVRRTAQLRLQDGGSQAMLQLTERLLQEDPKIEPAMLAGTLVEFGQQGIDILREASFLADPEKRQRILFALAEVPGNHFSLELASALVGSATETSLSTGLAERLSRRFGKLPEAEAVHQHVAKALDNSLMEYRLARDNSARAVSGRLDSELLTDTIWLPSPTGESMKAHPTTREMVALARLSQVAWMLGQLSNADRSDVLKAGAVGLQRLHHFGLKGIEHEEGTLLYSFPQPQLSDPQYWIGVFQQATEWEMHGAAVMAIQMMTERIEKGELTAPIEFLSSTLTDPRPPVRYAAFEAIAQVDPRSDYSGSERALSTALEMLRLGAGPQALLVGSNLDLVRAAQGLVSQQTNVESITVTSGRETLRSLTVSHPADLVVIVDRVQDMSLFELLQRIKNSQGGSMIPIAVLVPELSPYEQQWIDKTPGAITGILSEQSDEMGIQLQRLIDSMDVLPLTRQQRSRYAEIAEEFISRIAQDRATYAFYPFDQWKASLVSLPSSASALAQSQVLAGLNSPAGQQRLIQLVAASGAAEQERQIAARGFERSVEKFGLLLDRKDIQMAYDLYNRLGPNDASIAKVMGSVLDVIESSMRP